MEWSNGIAKVVNIFFITGGMIRLFTIMLFFQIGLKGGDSDIALTFTGPQFISKSPLGSGFQSPLKLGNLANISLDNFTPRGSIEQGYMFRQNKLLYCSANFKKG